MFIGGVIVVELSHFHNKIFLLVTFAITCYECSNPLSFMCIHLIHTLKIIHAPKYLVKCSILSICIMKKYWTNIIHDDYEIAGVFPLAI